MKYALLSLLSMVSASLFAQEEERVVIVKRDDYRSSRYHKKEERDINNYNAFKFDPFRMAIGELNFSWETRIGEKTSLEVELGPTVSNLWGNRYYTIDGVSQQPVRQNSRMGILASVAVRYYPLEETRALNKLYISPRIKYRRYNEVYTSSYEGLGTQPAGSNEFIFSFNIGFQQWFSHNFAFDYYIGAGIGSFNGNSFTVGETYDGNTGQWSYNWKESNTSYARFLGVIGMKVTVGN